MGRSLLGRRHSMKAPARIANSPPARRRQKAGHLRCLIQWQAQDWYCWWHYPVEAPKPTKYPASLHQSDANSDPFPPIRAARSGNQGAHPSSGPGKNAVAPLHQTESVRWDRTARPRPGDRKSTRLNSSHVSSSYAVFCLKKKKKYIKIHYCKKNKKDVTNIR